LLALRRLAWSRLFTATAVLTLAIGIGVSTAVFSLVDGVLLRPLPIRDPARVSTWWSISPSLPDERIPLTYTEYQAAIAATRRAFDGVAAVDFRGTFPRPVGEADSSTLANVTYVTGSFPEVLGIVPEVGRTLRSENDVAGAAPEVMLSYRYWQRTYGGDPGVIGRTLIVAGRTAMIVGVLPAGFDFPRGTEIWAPLLPYTARPDGSTGTLLELVGRRAQDVTAVQARAEMDAFFASLGADARLEVRRAMSAPLTDVVVGPARSVLLALGAGTGLLLLMTCVNVTILILSRTAAREQEWGLLVALGADRWRAVATPLFECAVLAILGGALGIAIASGLVRALVALAPPELPRLGAVGINGRTLAYTASVSMLVAMALGFAPLAVLTTSDLMRVLRGYRGTTSTVRRWARPLVVTQLAVSLVVLVGATLSLRSLDRILHKDLGFEPQHLLVARIITAPGRSVSAADAKAGMRSVAAAVSAVPNVRSVTSALLPPFTGDVGWDVPYATDEQLATEASAAPQVSLVTTTPSTLTTLETPLLAGRDFTPEDGAGGAPVAIVSAELARLLWPGRAPLEQRIRISDVWYQVIGVATDTHYREIGSARPTVYVPESQTGLVPAYLLVRTRGRPEQSIAAIRRVILESGPNLIVPQIVPMSVLMDTPLARPRFMALLLGALAGAALVLAAAGLYGVLGTFVEERRREIGIRVAVGASRRMIIAYVLRQGLTLAAAGVVLGTALALAGAHTLRMLLFGVTPVDPLSYTIAVAVFLGMALAACAVPAMRALRIDPQLLLRDM